MKIFGTLIIGILMAGSAFAKNSVSGWKYVGTTDLFGGGDIRVERIAVGCDFGSINSIHLEPHRRGFSGHSQDIFALTRMTVHYANGEKDVFEDRGFFDHPIRGYYGGDFQLSQNSCVQAVDIRGTVRERLGRHVFKKVYRVVDVWVR